MAHSRNLPELDPTTRTVLRASGPVNVLGALILAPPLPFVRSLFGLPQGHEIYLWMLSLWVLAFGWAYWTIGTSGRAEPTFLAVATFGKATFGLLLVAYALTGALPGTAALLGLPDLFLAAFFARWLLATRD